MNNPGIIGDALIVGGTGMLTKVSAHLARTANKLTIVSRNPFALADKLNSDTLELDWKNLAEAKDGLGGVTQCDLIVSWVHEEGLELIVPLETKLKPGGRSIRVHGCKAANSKEREKVNAGSRADIMRQSVILGLVNRQDGSRWLTHNEICDGVIHAIEYPSFENFVVGSLDQSRPLL